MSVTPGSCLALVVLLADPGANLSLSLGLGIGPQLTSAVATTTTTAVTTTPGHSPAHEVSVASSPLLRGAARGAAGALVYALAGFAKHRAEDQDSLNPNKLLATMLVGAVLGMGAVLNDVRVTETYLAAELSAYAGAVAVVQNAIRALRSPPPDGG